MSRFLRWLFRRFSLCVIVVIPTTSLAQIDSTLSDELTLHELVRRGLDYHPQVARSFALARSASAQARVVGASRIPSLNLEASATRFKEPMIVAPLHGFDPNQPPEFAEWLYQSRWVFEYTMFDGGRRGAETASARAQRDAADAGVDAAQHEVIATIASAFLDVLSARRINDAELRRLAALEAERDRVQQLLDAERAAEVERLRIEAALANARAAQIAASSELTTATRELARLTGASASLLSSAQLQRVALRDSSTLPSDELERLALERNPAVERARRQVSASQFAGRAARAAWLPTVRLTAGALTFAGASSDFTAEWQGGVALSYPLFTGGARTGRIAQAASQLTASEEELRQVALEVTRMTDRALAAALQSHAQVAALTSAVAHLTEVARIERLALSAGAGVQTDYLTAEADLVTAEASLTRAQHAEVAARIELARATGALSLDWLGEHLENRP